jgi:hypothetical protein
VTPVTALPPGEAGAWLAAAAHDHPQQVATAVRLMAAGGRSNDSCLHARQYLEPALGAAPGRQLSARDYLTAAALLHRSQAGLAAGDVMQDLAATDGELRAAAPAWLGRYAARPLTQPERAAAEQVRNGDVVESGYAGQGIDGAHYSRAYYPRSSRPAVVVTTSAMSEEVVNFPSTLDAGAWLASRLAGGTAPLPTRATGPGSRTGCEEELLAFLVREPASAARLTAGAGPATFTTHLRAELHAALRWVTAMGGAPGYPVIAEAFGRRLLRAPAAAAADIGWPDATRAMTYLHRLAATPVTRDQAESAATRLAQIDAAARPGPQARALVPAPARAPAPARKRLAQPPPAPVPGPGSLAPRL